MCVMYGIVCVLCMEQYVCYVWNCMCVMYGIVCVLCMEQYVCYACEEP